MKAWILSVIGLSLTFFVLKIIMPEKKTMKTIVLIYSLISVVYLLTPLLALNGSSDNFSFFSDKSTFYTECDAQSGAYMQKYYEVLARDVLKGEHVTIKDMKIFLNEDNYSLKKISINYKDLGYEGKNEHIDIASLTKSTLAEYFFIPETMVNIYGKD